MIEKKYGFKGKKTNEEKSKRLECKIRQDCLKTKKEKDKDIIIAIRAMAMQAKKQSDLEMKEEV